MAFSLSFTHVLVALYLVFYTSTVVALPTFDAFVDKSGDGSNITVAVNVPSNRTSDLFFTYSAPAQWQWGAFGFGGQMKGALIFVVYTSQDGKNVTVSPRIAGGRTMPVRTKDVTVEILNGTGLINNKTWVVNARCSGCRKWSGGSIDITSQDQEMIYAVGPKGTGFKSDNLDLQISKHDNHGVFSLDLKKATGEAGVPVLTALQGTDPGTINGQKQEKHEFPIMIHAVLVIGCFLVLLPAGYLFLRVFNRVWLHAGIQSLALICLLAGVAAGIVFNVESQRQIAYHQILGILTTLLILGAFILGAVSHTYYKKHSTSSPLLKFHRILGPLTIILGNGTVLSGFAFRGEPSRILPYSLVFIGVLILVGSVGFVMKRRAVKAKARMSVAAQNFNVGYVEQNAPPVPVPAPYANQAYFAPNSPTREGVGMQTFTGPFATWRREQEGRQAAQNAMMHSGGNAYGQTQAHGQGQDQRHGYGYAQPAPYKAPSVATRIMNRI